MSYTNTPEQNGAAERKYGHIVKTDRSLLLRALVPSEFWGEAVLTVVSLINTISSYHSSGFSFFEKLYGYVPDYFSFRVFGCTCFVLRPHAERSKLYSQSVICVFLGYGEAKRGIVVLIQ
jgi:histone deacetylase 1/2